MRLEERYERCVRGWRLVFRHGSYPQVICVVHSFVHALAGQSGSSVHSLEEEVGEFVTASEKRDLIGIADALADIVYVTYGTALTYGIDLDSALLEVHRSNMSKLGRDGKPLIREDGKVLKSEQYFPPDIAALLSQQGPLRLP